MNAPQRILVPTDFSEYADKALQKGLFLTKRFNAQLYLLHVVQDIEQCAVDYCLSDEFVKQHRTGSIEAARQKLKNELDKLPEAKEVQIGIDVRLGGPDGEILREAKEKNIDLIVIASHGKTGFLQHLMGSVAERVSRGAKCDVLLVKA
ncbi:MAG: universal stress protein [Deltaproteobacteria bacterium]|nr:universal stress protein [Deltaproteobacteria bacterium]